MRNITKKITVIMLSVLMIISFADVSAFASSSVQVRKVVKPIDWMKTLSDDAKIADVNLPGTHDTCCVYFKNTNTTTIYAKTQSLALPDQFKAGARFFDIRLCVTGKNDTDFHVPHNMCITADKNDKGAAMTMGKVVAYAEEFLAEHPSETIILMYSHDDRYYDDYQETYDSLKEEMLESFRNNNNRVILESENCDLTVGEMRGKVAIVSGSTIPGYIGMCDYKAETKWREKGQEYFDSGYLSHVGKLKCVNLSAQGRENKNGKIVLIPPLYDVESAIMNQKIMNYDFIKNDPYGWFIMDYINEELCKKIYMISADENKGDEEIIPQPVVAKLKLSGKKYSNRRIKLSWTCTSSSAKKYSVYAARSGKKLKKIATTSKKYYIVKKASGKKLQKGKKYKFYVVALSKSGKIIKTNGKTLKSSTITIKR